MEAIAKHKVGVVDVSNLLEMIEHAKGLFGIDGRINDAVMIRQYEYFKYQYCAELFEYLQKYDLPLEITPLKFTPISENYSWLKRDAVRINAVKRLLDNIETADNGQEHATELYEHFQKYNLPLEIAPFKLTEL